MQSGAEPLLLPYYPRLVYLALRDRGFSEQQLFDGLELSAERLDNERFRLTVAQHEQFILRTLELTGNPHLALELGDLQNQSSANVALLAVANSGQVARAIRLVCRYNKILTRVFSVRPGTEHQLAILEISPLLQHEQVIYFAVTAFALFLDRFFADALGGAHLVQKLELSVSEPSGFADVRERFGFDLKFGQQQSRIHLHEALLSQPMKQADPQTVRLLTEMSEKQLQEADAEGGIINAVRALLHDELASPPRLDEAALALGISSRGLRRKLAQAGTSYQQLLDSVRLQVASRLLTETQLQVSAVGYELGFSNASDFARAFKRWSGRPPSALRR